MGKCKYYRTCGLEDAAEPDEHLCILHSPDPEKDQSSFKKALQNHRQLKERANRFDRIVFPSDIDFSGTTFDEGVSFYGAIFLKEALFMEAKFQKYARFSSCTFSEFADFSQTSFNGFVWFNKAKFKSDGHFAAADFSARCFFDGALLAGEALFGGATFTYASFRSTEFRGNAEFGSATFTESAFFHDLIFSKKALFPYSRFNGEVIFANAIFEQDADFSGAIFSKEGAFSDVDFGGLVNFRRDRFLGPVLFSTSKRTTKMFASEATFEQAVIMNESLVLMEVDLRRCRFLGSDARRIHFVGVRWPQVRSRSCVYDETAPLDESQEKNWSQLEELYRKLKQNYEERRDYERAGHFHIGEKEMRLQNPGTNVNLRVLLAIYKGISGYGENYLRPLLWLIGLILVTAVTGLVHGLEMGPDVPPVRLSVNSLVHWGWAVIYALEIIFHLSATGFVPKGFFKAVQTFSSIIGPVFIALFVFALRQRLKR